MILCYFKNIEESKEITHCYNSKKVHYLVLLPGCLGSSPTKIQETLLGMFMLSSLTYRTNLLADIKTQNNTDNDKEFMQTHREQVITFHDQGNTTYDQAIPEFSDLDESYLSMTVAQDTHHDIVSFLERPVRVWSGNMTTSNTVGQVLWTASYPSVLIQNTMYNQKLQGFTGLRADLEVKVQVNAQKFQQGRLHLQYIPYADYLKNKVELINGSLAGRISSPGIDIDICGGSTPESRIAEAVFRVPYVSPHTYFNLINGDGKYGIFYLFVYSPLLTGDGGTDNCEITVWSRFVDPKVVFPTGATIGSAIPTRVAEVQIRGEAKQVAKEGVVSSTLGTVAEVLKIGQKLPVVGEYLAIPEWICDKGASIAKLFGWSKPTLAMDVKLRTNNCMSNYNGKDSSHKMALSADNEIDSPPNIAGTKVDELAISSIVTIPTYWQTFSWSNTDQTRDQILWIDKVAAARFNKIDGTTNGYATTPMGFLANVFAQWRGSINYTFKLVKTGFHSGRLRVFFVPQGVASTLKVGSAPTIEIEKNYQVVVDIAESDTFTFNVPFVATKPWLSTYGQSAFTGYIVVTVLNELRAPPVVSNKINIIVEVAGGSDFSFSMPCEPWSLTGTPTPSPPSGPGRVAEVQIAGTNVDLNDDQKRSLVDPDSISTINPVANWSPESHCIGEKIMSIRQLIKRANWIGTATMLPSSNTDQQYAVLNPFANASNQINTQVDYLSYFSNLFAFFRGGVRIKVNANLLYANGNLNNSTPDGEWFTPVNSNPCLNIKMLNAITLDYINVAGNIKKLNNIVGKVGFANADVYNSSTLNAAMVNSSSTTVVNQGVEGMVEVEIPYYNSTHLTPSNVPGIDDPLVDVDHQLTSEDTYPLPILLVGSNPLPRSLKIASTKEHYASVYKTEALVCNFYRAASDDYSYHYFIGVPTMIVRPPVGSDYYKPTN